MENPADKIDVTLSRKQAAKRLGYSVRTLQRLEAEQSKLPPDATPLVPRRVRTSERCIGYRNSEIDRFLESRVVA